MTTINPTLQLASPPSLVDVMAYLQAQIMKTMNCCRPGIIKSYSVGGAGEVPTATVQIAQKQVTSVQPDGTRTLADFPLLVKAPVYFCGGGGFTLTFPIAAGDECLVIFADREIDNWINSNSVQPPTTARMHDLSDGFVLVGIRSNPRALTGLSSTAVQLRSDNGETLVELSAGQVKIEADKVIIHARDKLCYDAGGTGYVVEPDEINTYTNGVTVINHLPDPPQVPE